MSKLKQPVISLGASGSLSNAITFQRGIRTDIVRKKPIPTYRNTLPQQYQRWLYEDYAYLWRQQSEATKQTYRTRGSRYHLTGYSLWMREHLRDLSDIAGYWKLDEASGAIQPDSSRNANDGTVIGASSTPGLIDGALYFDGVNDLVNCGNDPTLDLYTEFTFECFAKIAAGEAGILAPATKMAALTGWQFLLSPTRIYFEIRTTAGWENCDNAALTLSTETWYHLIAILKDNNLYSYINNVQQATKAISPPISHLSANLLLGDRDVVHGHLWWHGDLDNCILYDRALDTTERQRHSERRYP